MNLFGVADVRTLLKTTTGVIRDLFKLEFGELGKDDEFLASISPIQDADKIVDPLFVYAGANDPRVPRSESDMIVAAARKKGVPVEYMVKDNEGHSLARKENQLEFYARSARFLEKHLALPTKQAAEKRGAAQGLLRVPETAPGAASDDRPGYPGPGPPAPGRAHHCRSVARVPLGHNGGTRGGCPCVVCWPGWWWWCWRVWACESEAADELPEGWAGAERLTPASSPPAPAGSRPCGATPAWS